MIQHAPATKVKLGQPSQQRWNTANRPGVQVFTLINATAALTSQQSKSLEKCLVS